MIVEPLQRVLLPEPGFLEALRDVTRRHGIVLDLRRDRHRLPDRLGRRAGALRRRARHRVLRQGDERRLPDGGDRRQRRRDVACSTRARGRATRRGLGDEHAERQPDLRRRRQRRARRALAARRLRPLARIGGAAARRASVEAGERHGFAVQAPGEDAVFGVRFTDRRPLRTWIDLTTADKDLGLRWAVELLQRGLLVNPNEKFYISIAHTDADVDRTLEIADEAFAAMRAATPAAR